MRQIVLEVRGIPAVLFGLISLLCYVLFSIVSCYFGISLYRLRILFTKWSGNRLLLIIIQFISEESIKHILIPDKYYECW